MIEDMNVHSVRIEKIRVAGQHGVSTIERQSYNTLEVTTEVWADDLKAELTDELADTINYSHIHKLILEVVRNTSFKLLESLANAIINKLFEDKRITSAMVTIAKPERLEGATPSVTMFRNAVRSSSANGNGKRTSVKRSTKVAKPGKTKAKPAKSAKSAKPIKQSKSAKASKQATRAKRK